GCAADPDAHSRRGGDYGDLGPHRCIPDPRVGEKSKQPSRCAAWRVGAKGGTMNPPRADPTALARDLLRCPSVTPPQAGAPGLIEGALKAAGFTVHRVTFGGPGTAPVHKPDTPIGPAN